MQSENSPFRFSCPECETTFCLPGNKKGSKVKCKCGVVFRVGLKPLITVPIKSETPPVNPPLPADPTHQAAPPPQVLYVQQMSSGRMVFNIAAGILLAFGVLVFTVALMDAKARNTIEWHVFQKSINGDSQRDESPPEGGRVSDSAIWETAKTELDIRFEKGRFNFSSDSLLPIANKHNVSIARVKRIIERKYEQYNASNSH